ncbi:MAG TPA: PHP domain-containing protein [Spirochaetota bacterium]
MDAVDLHIHSCHSEDGDFSVEEIFRLAHIHNLTAIALTDHDTLSSINEGHDASRRFGVEFLPGFEITTVHPEDQSQQHILCYFADPDNEDLKTICRRVYADRINLARERLDALAKIGFRSDPMTLFSGEKNRPLTATSVVHAVLNHPENRKHPLLAEYYDGDKRNDQVMSFYREFLAKGKPGFAPLRSIETKDAIELVLRAKALPVLAHPVFVANEQILNDITSSGIVGIEAYSSYHTEDDTKRYLSFAKANRLIVTAGSDFHGPTAKPKVGFASVTGSYEMVEKLLLKKESL